MKRNDLEKQLMYMTKDDLIKLLKYFNMFSNRLKYSNKKKIVDNLLLGKSKSRGIVRQETLMHNKLQVGQQGGAVRRLSELLSRRTSSLKSKSDTCNCCKSNAKCLDQCCNIPKINNLEISSAQSTDDSLDCNTTCFIYHTDLLDLHNLHNLHKPNSVLLPEMAQNLKYSGDMLALNREAIIEKYDEDGARQHINTITQFQSFWRTITEFNKWNFFNKKLISDFNNLVVEQLKNMSKLGVLGKDTQLIAEYNVINRHPIKIKLSEARLIQEDSKLTYDGLFFDFISDPRITHLNDNLILIYPYNRHNSQRSVNLVSAEVERRELFELFHSLSKPKKTFMEVRNQVAIIRREREVEWDNFKKKAISKNKLLKKIIEKWELDFHFPPFIPNPNNFNFQLALQFLGLTKEIRLIDIKNKLLTTINNSIACWMHLQNSKYYYTKKDKSWSDNHYILYKNRKEELYLIDKRIITGINLIEKYYCENLELSHRTHPNFK